MIDLAKIAAAEKARAAFPFGSHPRDDLRVCRCCMDRTEARYEDTRVSQLEDDGPLLLVRSYTCGSCGSTTVSNCELAPAGSALDAIADRRERHGREQSGVHALPSLTVPEDAGRYSLPGNLIDDAPVRISRWA